MNANFHHLVNVISDAILILDENGIIVEANDTVEEIFHYSKGELIGQSISVLLPKKFRETHAKLFSGFVKNPSFRRMGGSRELFAERKNGESFDVDIALSFYNEGKENFFVAAIRDITRIKDIERDLQKTNQNLQEFAYMVTHDLKSPLNNIVSLLKLLNIDDSVDVSQKGRKTLDVILKEAGRMSHLIEDILEFSKVGSVDLEVDEFNFSDLLRDVQDSITVPDKFEITVDNAISKIRTSPKQLFQVISNLLENAIKYHDRTDGIIHISTEKKRNKLSFSITDDGPGIDKDFHEKVFKMFGTANAENRPDSTGIGLAIVKKIVEQNDGHISLKSNEDRGSCFEFDWKLEQ